MKVNRVKCCCRPHWLIWTRTEQEEISSFVFCRRK